jgi:peptidoglycan/LPS O-acetylase OafA/YrhL
MKTASIAYIPRIDHLRFFAALLIMIFHFAKNDFTKTFEIGVDLFFTLSGFIFILITKAGEHEIDYWKFIYNRFLRIFPLVIVLFFTVITVMRNKFHATDIFQLLFLNMPAGTSKFGWGNNSLSFPWWTVGIEFCFYLIFPFLIRFYKQYGISYLIKLILLVIALRYIVYFTRAGEDGYGPTIMSIHYSILGHLDTFIVGMMAGIFYLRKDKFNKLAKVFSSKIFLALILVLIPYLLHLDILEPTLYGTLYGLLCSLFILSYLTVEINIPEQVDRLFSSLGTTSFSIYLLHIAIVEAVKTLEINTTIKTTIAKLGLLPLSVELMMAFLIYIPLVCLFSCLSYNVIEKPFLEMRVKYIKSSVEN